MPASSYSRSSQPLAIYACARLRALCSAFSRTESISANAIGSAGGASVPASTSIASLCLSAFPPRIR